MSEKESFEGSSREHCSEEDIQRETERLRAAFNSHQLSGAWLDCIEVGEALLRHFPDEAQIYRGMSGCFAQLGKMVEARNCALSAVRKDPTHPEFLLHAGIILIQCAEYSRATHILLKCIKLAPFNAEAYQQLAFVAAQLGNTQLSTKLAERAYTLDPDTHNRGVILAHAYARESRWHEAIFTMREVVTLHCNSSSAHRILSGFLTMNCEFEAALTEIDISISLDPLNSELYIHRVNVLNALGRHTDTKEALLKALELDPENLWLRRHSVSLFLEAGEVEQALRQGAELVRQAPHEDEYASCMRYLLDARDARSLTADLGDIATLKASMPPRELRPIPTFFERFQNQAKVIGALILRDIRSRYGKSRIAFLWALMEPTLHIGVLALVFQFTMKGRPPMGEDYFMFYFTGVMPYLLLSHLVMHIGHAVKDSRHMMQIPLIHPIDLVIAKAVVELFTTALVYTIFSIGFYVAGIDALPFAPGQVFGAFALTMVMGVGIGALCAALNEFGSIVDHIVGLLLRLAYFASGIFYIPGQMPVVARDILAWNPFLHVIDMNRLGYFSTYMPHWYDPSFATLFSLFALTVGLGSVFILSRYMRSHL